MIDNLPVQTAQIYDYLSKGNFLCSNTTVKELRTLFSVVEDNFERLRDYFSHINFVLEQGNNYFYFSRKEPRATLEQKLQRFFVLFHMPSVLSVSAQAGGVSSPSSYHTRPPGARKNPLCN